MKVAPLHVLALLKTVATWTIRTGASK